MDRTEMTEGLMRLRREDLKTIADRAGYRANIHTMNKEQLTASIVESYNMEKWIDQRRKDWIVDCINKCERVI